MNSLPSKLYDDVRFQSREPVTMLPAGSETHLLDRAEQTKVTLEACGVHARLPVSSRKPVPRCHLSEEAQPIR